MEYHLKTKLNGDVALTYDFHNDKSLMGDSSLYKFFWVQDGEVTFEIDHVDVTLGRDEILPITPLHHVAVKNVEGTYLCLLFNSNFYCIYGHDNEVSCNGFLFNGSSSLMKLNLTPEQSAQLHSIADIFQGECSVRDDLQEEMLRIVLKRFIITCTRIARQKYEITAERERSFDVVRQFYVLVDQHFKEKKQVRDYAEMLFRSPKTLSNLCADYGFPTPLQIIHERVYAEAARLLLYTSRSAKEIGSILGFEDIATFSRFFKKMTGKSIKDFRKEGKQE